MGAVPRGGVSWQAVEAIFRLMEFVHAPFYALFVVGPIANLIEISLTKRRSRSS